MTDQDQATEQPPEGFSLDAEAGRQAEAATSGMTERADAGELDVAIARADAGVVVADDDAIDDPDDDAPCDDV
jgi:hypothetical protein